MPPMVLFDLDNTLVDRRSAFGRWTREWGTAYGLEVDASDWLVDQDRDGYRSRVELFEAAAARFGLDMNPELLVAEYRDQVPTFFEPDPMVIEGLGELLRRGWRIGVVTNGSTAQRSKLASAQLSHLVDGVCVSGEVGVRKPDPVIFRAAAEAANATLDQGWMVGDNPEADIPGGIAAGLRTMWISHGFEWPLPDVRPHAFALTIHAALGHLLELATPRKWPPQLQNTCANTCADRLGLLQQASGLDSAFTVEKGLVAACYKRYSSNAVGHLADVVVMMSSTNAGGIDSVVFH